MSFNHDIFVSFHLVDRAGILFFGHVFTFAHQAFEQFISKELNMSWLEWFQNENWIIPIKQTEALYQSPIATGQMCSIKLHIEELKNSSFISSYSFYQNDVECCIVKICHTFCSPSTKRKIDIPNHIREKLVHTQSKYVKI